MKRSWIGSILSAMLIAAVAVLLGVLLPHFNQPPKSPDATLMAALDVATGPLALPSNTSAALAETATALPTITATPGWPLKLHDPDMLGELEFSPDGMLLASSQRDGSVILWDVTSGTQKSHLNEDSPSLDLLSTPSILPSTKNMTVGVGLDFSPDGRLLAVDKRWYRGRGGRDLGPLVPIEIWNAETGALQRSLLEVWGPENSRVAFTPDGDWLVVARGMSDQYPAGALTFWNTRTWTSSYTVAADTTPGINPAAIAFTPDSKTLITMSGYSDMLDPLEVWPILFWDIPSGRLNHTWNVGGTVLMMALSRDGTKLALTITETGSDIDAYTEVIDPTTEKVLVERGILPSGWGRGLVFSPDGSLLAMRSSNGFELINVATGMVVRSFTQPGELLHVPVFSQDGTLIAAQSSEDHIVIWRMH